MVKLFKELSYYHCYFYHYWNINALFTSFFTDNWKPPEGAVKLCIFLNLSYQCLCCLNDLSLRCWCQSLWYSVISLLISTFVLFWEALPKCVFDPYVLFISLSLFVLFQLDHYPPVSYKLPEASDIQFDLVKTLFLGKVYGESFYLDVIYLKVKLSKHNND